MREWPVVEEQRLVTQADAAEVFAEAKAAYDSCTATVNITKPKVTND